MRNKITKIIFFSIKSLAFLFFFTISFNAFSATIVVDKTADENDGSCADGDCSLRDAINSAASGDIITLPAGTYNLTMGHIFLGAAKTITINGGGKLTTIINGSGNGNRFLGLNNSLNITFNDLTIQGFTAGADAGLTGALNRGAVAYYNTQAAILIFNKCIVQNNTSSVRGGAFYMDGAIPSATMTATDCLFHNNSTSALNSDGGLIYSEGGTITMSRCLFTDNSTNESDPGSDGGVIRIATGTTTGSAVILENCTFTSNSAHEAAVGEFNGTLTVTIRNCTVNGNSTTDGSSGAIRFDTGGGASIANTVVFENNIAFGNTGPDVSVNSTLNTFDKNVVENCTGTCPGWFSITNPSLGALADNGGETQTMSIPTTSVAKNASNNAVGNDQRGFFTEGGTRDIGAFEFMGTILPIELTSFKAEKYKEEVKILWETLTETNNEYFSIEHSTDGERFESIGMMDGSGDSFEPQNYSLTHKNPQAGLNYYRLKQVDFDDQFSYSNIEVVNFDSEIRTIGFNPNPFTSEVTIKLEKSFSENTNYTIHDMMGKLVYEGLIEKDILSKTLNLSKLQSGVFILRIGNGENTISQKIVKF